MSRRADPGTRRRQGRRGLAVGVVALVLCGIPAAMVADPVGADTTTTTVVPTTTSTTVAPDTTTTSATIPPTTTSSEPATTTTSTSTPARSTTTTSTPSTTTTTPVTTTSGSSIPWGLIVLIVVLVAAIVAVVVLLASRRRTAAEARWRQVVTPALSDARLARDSLLSGNPLSEDAQTRGAVDVQVERAASALERAAAAAPDDQAGALATSGAASLRGLAFAIEADRLLRHGTVPPSGAQLAQADEARRARDSELATALARLSTRVSGRARGRR